MLSDNAEDLTKHYWTYKHFGNFVKRALLIFHFYCRSYHAFPFSPYPIAGSVRQPLTGSDVQQWMMAVSTPTTFNVIAMNPNTTAYA